MTRNPTTNDRMRAESRAAILASASRLFARQGYFNTTIAQVARAAGMSQGNLYWYFATKEQLLQALLQEGFEAYLGVLEGAAAAPGGARAQLDALILNSLHAFQSLSDFFSILLALLGHGGQPLLLSLGFDMEQTGRRYHHHAAAVFAAAQAEGLIPPADPAWQAVCFFSFFNGMFLTYKELIFTFPPEQVRGAVYGMLGAKA